jgi:hypothetical protein
VGRDERAAVHHREQPDLLIGEKFMATKKTDKTEKQLGAPVAPAAEVEICPTFVLRADKKGHIRALMAALQELPNEQAEGLRTLREFDLWEEMHR